MDHQAEGAFALGPGEGDVVAGHRDGDGLARVQRHRRDANQAQGEGRKQQVVQPVEQSDLTRDGPHRYGAADRGPLQRHGEDVEQQKPDPERRRGRERVRPPGDDAIGPATTPYAGDQAEDEADHTGQAPGDGHQGEAGKELPGDHGGDRLVERVRVAEVAAGDVRQPGGEAFERRVVQAPAFRDLGALLGSDGRDVAADVRVDRVDG
jgi:hypothetical protein